MLYLSPLDVSRQQYHQNLPFNAHFEALFPENNSAIKMNHLQNLLPSKSKISNKNDTLNLFAISYRGMCYHHLQNI